MKRTLVIAMVAVGLLVGPAWTLSKSTAEPISTGSEVKTTDVQKAEFDAAFARFKNRDFDGAYKLVVEAVKKNPDLPPANLIMAQWFSMANIPQGVRNALEQVVMEYPEDPEAYIIMGDIAMRERRVTEALLLYNKANDLIARWKGSEARKKDMLPRVPAGLASTALARGKWAEAQTELETWLKLDPKNVGAIQQLASCLFQLKNVDAALAKLNEAAALDKNMLLPETMLAQLYKQSGDPENAGKWVIAALTKAPKDLRSRLFAAELNWEIGRLEEAEKQATYAKQLDPASLDAKILLGVIALFKKDYKTAEYYFEAAHIQSPNNFSASNNLALALVEQKFDDKQKSDEKKQRALEYATTNVQQYAKSNDASKASASASTYGWVLYKIGRHEDAEQWLKAALNNQSPQADTVFYLARVLVDHGKEADAQRLLEGALNTKGPFAYRAEAQALLDSLKKK